MTPEFVWVVQSSAELRFVTVKRFRFIRVAENNNGVVLWDHGRRTWKPAASARSFHYTEADAAAAYRRELTVLKERLEKELHAVYARIDVGPHIECVPEGAYRGPQKLILE